MFIFKFCRLILRALVIWATSLSASARETINFNRDWKFKPGDTSSNHSN